MRMGKWGWGMLNGELGSRNAELGKWNYSRKQMRWLLIFTSIGKKSNQKFRIPTSNPFSKPLVVILLQKV